jgi:hypothetical protein
MACFMTFAGTGKSISTMRVIFTRPTCQLSIALTAPRFKARPDGRLGARGSGFHPEGAAAAELIAR